MCNTVFFVRGSIGCESADVCVCVFLFVLCACVCVCAREYVCMSCVCEWQLSNFDIKRNVPVFTETLVEAYSGIFKRETGPNIFI